MTEYQQLDEIEKKLIIFEINHTLLYDAQAYRLIMDVVNKSTPNRPIILLPKKHEDEN
jgi:hypothetical protein